MNSCVFPGSFDPVTNGHLDLIRRIAERFDRVTVTVMVNMRKQGAFTPDERTALLKKACAGMENVRVDRWDGLLADYMRNNHENCVIRGVRNAGEYETEALAAEANRILFPGMETLLLPASEGYACISSSTLKEIAAFGGEIGAFVPDCVAEEIRERLTK